MWYSESAMGKGESQNGVVSVFAVISVIAILMALVGGVVYLLSSRLVAPAPVMCTLEAMQCPDGSYVGRTGPNCEFSPCPGFPSPSPAPGPAPEPQPVPPPSSGNCTSDAQCPPGAMCQATQGFGTVEPNGGPSTFTIEKGECRWKEGSRCAATEDCQAGLICHDRVCTAPQDGTCAGDGASCPQGYRCIQDCGPPVARENDPPPGWHCVLEEVASQPRACPICLASNTMIDTPDGAVGVKDVNVGTVVWSVDRDGRKIASEVLRVSRSPVPPTHRVVHLVMTDGREVWVSPDHPTSDGRRLSDLRAGDAYDGGTVATAEAVPYWDVATYDLLPAGDTGAYWANGILLGNTLDDRE